MEQYTFHQRLKWAAGILCVLLLPLVGMIAGAGFFWQHSLTMGIAVGGVIGLALYLAILWQELKLRQHWRELVLSIPAGLLLVGYLLFSRLEEELGVLCLIYVVFLATLLPCMRELDNKRGQDNKNPSAASSRTGLIAVGIWVVLFISLTLFLPSIRAITVPMLWLVAVFVVLLGGVMVLARRVSKSPFQQASHAYYNQCDPRPMLEECTRQLSRRQLRRPRQQWLLQQAATLSDLGDTTASDRIAEGLLSSGKTLAEEVRVVCYYNLAESHCQRGNWVAAADCHAKAVAGTARCSNEKTRQALQGYLREQEGFLLYGTGDYRGAQQRFEQLGWATDWEDATKPLCTRVFHAYKLGMVYEKTGETALARAQLAFVTQHGNQLAVVQRAGAAITAMDSAPSEQGGGC